MKYYHFEFINRNNKTYLRNVFVAVAKSDSDNHFAVNMQWLRQLKLHNNTDRWLPSSMSYHFRVIALFGFAPSSAMPQLPLFDDLKHTVWNDGMCTRTYQASSNWYLGTGSITSYTPQWTSPFQQARSQDFAQEGTLHIFSCVRYFRSHSFHAKPITAMLKYDRIDQLHVVETYHFLKAHNFPEFLSNVI